MNTKKNILASTIAFFMGSGVQGVVAQEDVGGQEESEWALEEIVVTATKREASLQDTSMAISVLSKDTIENRGLVNLSDYLATIPGASYIEISATNKNVVLRGLSAGPLDPQAVSSIYLGEMPLSSALDTFDINLVDMEQVEVVKGPQGTLYGASALGGIIRNTPAAPNLTKTEGNVGFDVSMQDETDETNKAASGVINVPLIKNKLALRATAYQFDNAGYIDIISSPEVVSAVAASGARAVVKDDSGGSTSKGGRVSLRWSPTDQLQVSLMVGAQKDDIDGRNDVSTALGAYKISYLNAEPSEKVDTEYTNFLIEYDFGWMTVLSSSSVLENEGNQNFNAFPVFPNGFLGPLTGNSDYDTSLKSQEIRFVSELNSPWQFLTGLYYEDARLETIETSSWIGNQSLNPFMAETLRDVETVLNYNQKAVFGELSYQITHQWKLAFGGRHFKYDRIDTTTYRNNAPLNNVDSEEDVSQSDSTYKANISYNPNDDTLLYAQWSEGFRLGRGQTLPPRNLCDTDNDGELDFDTGGILTTRVEPDTTENFELGLKLSSTDNRLTLNTALFRTNWDNLPIDIDNTSPNCPATGRITNNIGSARSQGVEIEASYLLDSWIISLSTSYMDTERTKVRSPLVEGESLIYAPRTNANLTLQYNFEIGAYESFIRTDIGYVGKYESSPQWLGLASAGDYVDINLRAGINAGSWSVYLYGSNITNNDDLRVNSNASDTSGTNMVGVRAIPRKIGLKISYSF